MLWTVAGDGAVGAAHDAGSAELPAAACVTPGVDPRQLQALGPLDRSHWLQPWRAYSDTWPAPRMRRAVGIEWSGETLDASPAVLAAAGVTRVRVPLLWETMSYDAPGQMATGPRDELRATLRAMRQARLRPLLMMYGHERAPGPIRAQEVVLMAAAAAGATRVRLDPAGLTGLVAGRSGLADLTDARASEVIFTAIERTGEVTLSKPLPKALASGRHRVTTLRFLPFARPLGPDGRPNPVFGETLDGWRAFVRAVAVEARGVMGDVGAFDLELWNVTNNHSLSLDINNYYDPPIDRGPGLAEDEIPRAIVAGTIAHLRDPAVGLGGVSVVDGFANTRWSETSSTAAAGLTALGRHVSVSGLRFPTDATSDESRPLDARGQVDGIPAGNSRWRDAFTPTYVAFFPEISLTSILPLPGRRSGQIVRDLAPLPTTNPRGGTHGRRAGLETWMTSVHTNTQWARTIGAEPTGAALWRFNAKVLLRSVAAFVGAGAEAVYFFAQRPDIALVDTSDARGGEPMRALSRFMGAFAGPDDVGTPRVLRLASVESCGSGVQFEGEPGAAGRPSLLDRDVVAFFPFQIDAGRFVAATYVMTRNVATSFAPAVFRLTLEGVGPAVTAQASDPLTGEAVGVTVVERAGGRLVIELPLSDSPRLVSLSGA